MSDITLKTNDEIAIMAQGGQRLATIVKALCDAVRVGMKTAELDRLAANMISEAGAESTFKGFHGYPNVSCISLNAAVVHGIPSDRIINNGDLVGLDLGLRYKGYCTDLATTIGIGNISPQVQTLLDVTAEALKIGLKVVKPGNHIGDIGHTIQEYVESYGFGVVRDLTGHGIGRQPHEEPPIPNFGRFGSGPLIKEGMVLAIEPMVTAGKPAVRQLDDGWTIATLDDSLAAHFEHTVAVTKTGHQILTEIC